MIRRCGGEAVEIRSASQLEGCQGMIIPGGESTTMANIARRWNLFDALREFEDEGPSGRVGDLRWVDLLS